MSTKWLANSSGGTWLTAADWSDGVPVPADVAIFASSAFGTVSLAAQGSKSPVAAEVEITAASVALAGGTLTLGQDRTAKSIQFYADASTVTVAAGASVTGTGTVDFASQVSFTLHGVFADSTAAISGHGDRISLAGGGADWSTTGSFYIGGTAAESLSIGEGATLAAGAAIIAYGVASINGSLSSMQIGTLEVGNGTSGTLAISAGAHVVSYETIIGNAAVADVSLTGAGSVLSTENGLELGDGPENARLTVTDGATLDFGGGLSVGGTLTVDGTALLDKTDYIVMSGGVTMAEAPPGETVRPNVILPNEIFLFGNGEVASAGSTGGVALILQGDIYTSEVAPEPLRVTQGVVVLQHAANDFPQVQIAGGALYLTATGAAGGHSIDFTGAAGSLDLASGVAVAEKITGFLDPGMLIDFAGLTGTSQSYTYTAAGAGGMLRVSDGTHSVSLSLTDAHVAGDFVLGRDAHGGTTIHYDAIAKVS